MVGFLIRSPLSRKERVATWSKNPDLVQEAARRMDGTPRCSTNNAEGRASRRGPLVRALPHFG